MKGAEQAKLADRSVSNIVPISVQQLRLFGGRSLIYVDASQHS